MNDHRPQYKHRCPSCKKFIFWEKVYCKGCIKADPLKGGFRLSKNQSRLNGFKGHRLTGVLPRKDQLFVILSNKASILCVECGKICDSRLKHRCYGRFYANNSVKYVVRKHWCISCKADLTVFRFPIVERKGVSYMSLICDKCLDGAKLIVVRKWQRRIHEMESVDGV